MNVFNGPGIGVDEQTFKAPGMAALDDSGLAGTFSHATKANEIVLCILNIPRNNHICLVSRIAMCIET
ncbi:hypothetical protein BPAE_0216g00150 [Botrytis paeoniae]|uniref:Uncharacterized protein n=1 Tax=Botrytis paeoniae TaxID=278948 RepID=A0A4Z1FFU6_9HELO|nr:hypothetical protein BPAE_0216g00150 [Botrytis paeoniae]